MLGAEDTGLQPCGCVSKVVSTSTTPKSAADSAAECTSGRCVAFCQVSAPESPWRRPLASSARNPHCLRTDESAPAVTDPLEQPGPTLQSTH